MQVDHVLDPLYLWKIHYVLLDLHCFRGELFEYVVAPVSIEIQACHVRPWHSVDDSIWVYHRYHEHIKVRGQVFGDWRVWDGKLHYFFSNEGAYSFARMLSAQYQNRILIVRLFFVKPDNRDDIVGNRISDRLHFHFTTIHKCIHLVADFSGFFEVIDKPGVWVRLAECEIHLIIVILKVMLKTQRIVGLFIVMLSR